MNDVFVNNVLYDNEASYTTHTSTNFKHDIVNNYFIIWPEVQQEYLVSDRQESVHLLQRQLLDTDKDGTSAAGDYSLLVSGHGHRSHRPVVRHDDGESIYST